MKEIRFFCEHCGDKVKPRDKICPSCGSFFSNVRCPACEFQGEVGYFIHGCPQCGYAGNEDHKHKSRDGIESFDWPQEIHHGPVAKAKKDHAKLNIPLLVGIVFSALAFLSFAIIFLQMRR